MESVKSMNGENISYIFRRLNETFINPEDSKLNMNSGVFIPKSVLKKDNNGGLNVQAKPFVPKMQIFKPAFVANPYAFQQSYQPMYPTGYGRPYFGM